MNPSRVRTGVAGAGRGRHFLGDKEEVGCLLRLLVVDGSSQEGGDAICFLRACQEALIQFCDSEIPDF